MSSNSFMQKLMELPLYEKISLDKDGADAIHDYMNGNHFDKLSIDLYCPLCKQISTFKPSNEGQMKCVYNMVDSDKFFNHYITFGIIHYRCAREPLHYFCTQIIHELDNTKKESLITKIGQYPAKAEIEFPEFNKFSKILPKEKLLDLKRSAGLASHGIGAGSFVYLRRVFEYLINEAYEDAINNREIDRETYEKARINERIGLLNRYLPEIMVENTSAYGILSKGVHELDENTCLNAYSLMKETIELILEEKLEKKQKEEKRSKIKSEISKLGSAIKKA
ncbi:hypothetical protein [Treponema socranskii]|uniref:hypothetical protein n=1 Tax=Treponema socranskii TaxID=53419 RepID=UPI002870C019|nr:hypothetical protein [Treponema socranskii]MDR9859522.1 hypothetical protein [Treponema socranskii]